MSRLRWPFALARTVDHWRLRFVAENIRYTEMALALKAANAELHRYKLLLGRGAKSVRDLAAVK